MGDCCSDIGPFRSSVSSSVRSLTSSLTVLKSSSSTEAISLMKQSLTIALRSPDSEPSCKQLINRILINSKIAAVLVNSSVSSALVILDSTSSSRNVT
ncbi:hypothetical protein WICPIJ_004393 [Wickerhamomyces pijperi]|uniref:Uncharacterized protein n=1 Tax=Wickerhamomyces pijperi TaxID=599730 RepID=A0A9P8Q613_WICPI|nr:hypothetical protein WICPIJ_004393 [Wickerhamomyces pijperi]